MEHQLQPLANRNTGVAKRGNVNPLQASVSECLSLLHSQRLPQSKREEISPRALALRENYKAVDIAAIYPSGLQTALVACRDIDTLHKVKDTPTFCMIEQAFGLEFLSRVWVKAQIIEVNDFVGTKTKLSDEQLDTLSDQIALEYGDLNLLEFICFCSRLRSGKYESFYGSVDPMQITKSLQDFYEDRRDDINRAWQAEEKARTEREWEESRKNAISFDEFWATLNDEQKAASPFKPLSEQEGHKKSFMERVTGLFTDKD